MDKYRFAEMIWVEIREAAGQDRVAVLPVATYEDHGAPPAGGCGRQALHGDLPSGPWPAFPPSPSWFRPWPMATAPTTWISTAPSPSAGTLSSAM